MCILVANADKNRFERSENRSVDTFQMASTCLGLCSKVAEYVAMAEKVDYKATTASRAVAKKLMGLVSYVWFFNDKKYVVVGTAALIPFISPM